MLNMIFILIFILSVYYLVKCRLNVKKAVEISKDALYPKKEDEFSSILLPAEWKEMEPLSKNTRSYQYVKWGSIIAIVLLSALLIILLFTNWLDSSYLSVAYWCFMLINLIKHRGNLFILKDGLIIHGRYYSTNEVKSYEIEQIVRWHALYGLDTRVNNAYKLAINVKKKLFQPNYIVVQDRVHLEKIMELLDKKGIPCIEKKEQSNLTIGNNTNKA